MPIYEYVCTRCEFEFEEIVRSSSEKVCCPDCGAKRVNRKMSTFAYHSSGGGGATSSSSSGSSCSGCTSSSCSSCH